MKGSAQLMEGRPPPLLTAIGVVAIIVIPLVTFVIVPNLPAADEYHGLNNGDYFLYAVTTYNEGRKVSGSLRVEITNVSASGYGETLVPTGIKGWTNTTMFYSWDKVKASYGSKVSTDELSTSWGLREVDKYFDYNGRSNITSYLGRDSGFLYRQDIVGDGYNISEVLIETSVEAITNGDK